MPACVAFGCTNRPEKKKFGLSFHRFPKDLKLRKAWIIAVRRKNWMPSHISTLCSEHFSEDQINRTMNSVRLHENAVPNIFKAFPSYCKKDVLRNNILIGNASESTSSEISDNDSATTEYTVSQFHLNSDDSECSDEISDLSKEDKLKYFIYESKKSSDLEDISAVTHEQALKSAKTLLRYMMNQDDVCQADITLAISYIKKISDKLLKEK